MKNILVTGGAGYIGSHVIRALDRAGYNPVVYDNLSSGRREFVEDFQFIRGDVQDSVHLSNTLKAYQIFAIIHLAGKIEVAESVANPQKYYLNNVVGSLNVIAAAGLNGVKRIVFSSTAAVYGENVGPLRETDELLPKSPYAVTKLFIEQALKAVGKADKLKHVSLRYFNAAGADVRGDLFEQHFPESHLIPRAIAAATSKKVLTVYGNDYPTVDGTTVRDYVHVNDIADAHVMALRYLENGGESDVFNIGTGEGYTVTEVLRAIQIRTGHKLVFAYGPRRLGDSMYLVANADKIKNVMGWSPKHNLNSIIDTAYNAWRNNGVIQ